MSKKDRNYKDEDWYAFCIQIELIKKMEFQPKSNRIKSIPEPGLKYYYMQSLM